MNKAGDGRRVAKVEREVQQAIAQFLIKGLRVSLPGLVTVARVIMPGDLRSAKVYVSVLGADDRREEVIETLQKNAREIQSHISQQMRMKHCPRLTFYIDDTTEHVLKIDRILHELSLEDQKKKGSE